MRGTGFQPLDTRAWVRALGVCLAVFAVALAASFTRASAQQPRSARDGIYTAAQATRGEALYKVHCAFCHGETLAGEMGPPLAGDLFLAIWGPMTMSDLVDKVQNTMPADAPGSLSRAQVVDIVAFVLQVSTFPAGSTELPPVDTALKQIALGGARAGAASAPAAGAATLSFPATGTVNQVMRGVLFPSSNVLFDVQTQDPGARRAGTKPEAGTTTARYGDVYEPWQVVDAAAIAIAESGPMLMTPRRCENGKPAPVDRADWQKYVQGLVDVGRAAYKASQSRNVQAVSAVTNDVSDACANCHRVYRDVASAAMRCTPP